MASPRPAVDDRESQPPTITEHVSENQPVSPAVSEPATGFAACRAGP